MSKQKKLNLVKSDEKTLDTVLKIFNSTKMDFPLNKTIHILYEEQVKRDQDTIALICSNETMTYRELNERSNQIGNYLRKEGVKPNDIVGLMVDRSFEMIIEILGILKSGRASLQKDPECPDDKCLVISYQSNIE